MNLKEAQEILTRLTYKPGTKFWLEQSASFGHIGFRITAEVLNAQTFLGLVPINFYRTFAEEFFEHLSADGFLNIVRECVLRLESHEVDEFLKFEGRHVRDPHPELKSMGMTPKLSFKENDEAPNYYHTYRGHYDGLWLQNCRHGERGD